MSDDNTFDARDEAVEHGAADRSEGSANGSDPTATDRSPSSDARPAEPVANPWARPEQSVRQRTSEVVGAIHEQVPVLPVHSAGRLGAHRAPTPGERAASAAAQAEAEAAHEASAAEKPLVPVEHMAAIIGARAALDRHAGAGTSLDHEPDVVAPEARPGRPAWLRLAPWAAGTLAAALAVGGIVFATTRKPVVVVTPTPTPSATTVDPVTDANLVTVAEMERVAPKQGWQVGQTLDRLATGSPRIACMPNTTGQPNPAITRQRTLTTTSSTGLAVLHQVDAFATPAEAATAFSLRMKQLAQCDNVPTWLAGTDKVTGLGDQATAVTVAYQDAVTQYHTVILSRTGTVVQAVDTMQANRAVPTKQVLPVAASAVNRQCRTSKGACAPAADAVATSPMVTATPGWLVPSDLPRVTPGAGLWTSTETQPVTTLGTQCENMTMASVAGPAKRDQRTYLMTQDSAAPQNFGVDEVLMDFATPAAAQAFAKTLQTNLATCQTRLATAKVSDAQSATVVVDGQQVGASTQMVTLGLGGTATVRYRTAVVTNGKRVVYLVNNPGPSYDLGKDRFLQVALRAGVRAGQHA